MIRNVHESWPKCSLRKPFTVMTRVTEWFLRLIMQGLLNWRKLVNIRDEKDLWPRNSIKLFLWHIKRKRNRWWEKKDNRENPQRNTARHLTMPLYLSCLSVFALVSALSILTRLFEWSLVVSTLMMPEYEDFCLWVSVDIGPGLVCYLFTVTGSVLFWFLLSSVNNLVFGIATFNNHLHYKNAAPFY